MEIQHVNIKLFLIDRDRLDLGAAIPVFHSWIQDQDESELLLDIADYRHVPSGPGIVLIGHHGNYSLDNVGGRLGVRYNRKAALDGSNRDRLVQATQAALAACWRLEADVRLEGKIQFNGHEIEVIINDRLLAPNNAETRTATEPEVNSFLSSLFGEAEYAVSYPQDARSLFSLHVTTRQTFDTQELLDGLTAAMAARP